MKDSKDTRPSAAFDGQDLDLPDVPQIVTLSEEPEEEVGKKAKGSHARQGQAAYIQKSARMRKILIAVIVVLVLLIVGAGFLVWQLYQTAQTSAVQQAQIAEDAASTSTEQATKDASATTSKKTTVPNLVALLGSTQDAAIQALQHGARVTSAVPLNEEGNPVKQEVRIALADEPADSKGGTPTVMLSLNEEGTIIRAGYSSSTSSLGYGSLSFSDIITKENVIEKTLEEAGLAVAQGAVTLPQDKMAYSTYASDGTTLTKESYTFSGTGQANGQELPWSALLTYDYSMANATGNLVDTIRTIAIYVG